MTKTTTILIMVMLIMASSVFAASSENEEQGFALESQDTNQPSPPVQPQRDNTPIIIITIFIAGLWYYKQSNGGQYK